MKSILFGLILMLISSMAWSVEGVSCSEMENYLYNLSVAKVSETTAQCYADLYSEECKKWFGAFKIELEIYDLLNSQCQPKYPKSYINRMKSWYSKHPDLFEKEKHLINVILKALGIQQTQSNIQF